MLVKQNNFPFILFIRAFKSKPKPNCAIKQFKFYVVMGRSFGNLKGIKFDGIKVEGRRRRENCHKQLVACEVYKFSK